MCPNARKYIIAQILLSNQHLVRDIQEQDHVTRRAHSAGFNGVLDLIGDMAGLRFLFVQRLVPGAEKTVLTIIMTKSKIYVR